MTFKSSYLYRDGPRSFGESQGESPQRHGSGETRGGNARISAVCLGAVPCPFCAPLVVSADRIALDR